MAKYAYVQIQWTTDSIKNAKEVARGLIERKWVACANIIPHIDSLYLWKGGLQEDQEVKVLFKTHDSHFIRVRDYILEHSSYDIPEIALTPILDGNPQYIAWISQLVSDA